MGASTGPTASRHRRARDEQACRGPPDTITAIKGGLLIVCRRPLSLGTLATNPARGWRHPKCVLSLIHNASQSVNVGVVSARFRFAAKLGGIRWSAPGAITYRRDSHSSPAP